MKWNLSILLLLCLANLHAQDAEKTQTSESMFTTYEKFDDFAPLLHQEDDTTYVVNFWATWCKPCVAELPYFEALAVKYSDQPVKVILVSLDFERQIEKKFKPFLRKHNLTPQVVLLTDGKATVWIDKVSPEWSGSIPATYIYKNDKNLFAEQEFESVEEIEELILSISKL